MGRDRLNHGYESTVLFFTLRGLIRMEVHASSPSDMVVAHVLHGATASVRETLRTTQHYVMQHESTPHDKELVLKRTCKRLL